MAETSPGGAPSKNRNAMIVLSYMWMLALVPLLTEKDDKEVQWHAKHGIVLMLTELVIFVLLNTLLVALGPVGCIFGLFMPLLVLAQVALHIMCMIKGVNGQRLIVPGLSEFADKF